MHLTIHRNALTIAPIVENVEEPTVSSSSGEPRAHTPAYASFDSSTDKLFHFFTFISRGVQSYVDEFKTKLAPEAMRLATEIARLGKPQAIETSDQETERGTPYADQDLSNARKSAEIDDRVQKISDTLLKPSNQFTAGLLTAREWIPVLLVTTVEAYLEDVLIYAAKVDPSIMESSGQSASYTEVVRSRSRDELIEELQSRWARKNFVDDGGPGNWINKLTKMGARGYHPEAAHEMETLWGVRHLIVHSRGVATPEFVRRHPEICVKVGESILIRPAQLTAWITVVYHFVDITDFYFVQRAAAVSSSPLDFDGLPRGQGCHVQAPHVLSGLMRANRDLRRAALRKIEACRGTWQDYAMNEYTLVLPLAGTVSVFVAH